MNNPFSGMSNPYLQENIDATMGDMARNYNLLQKPQMESAMVNSGSFGNSGLQQLQQNQMYDQQKAMGNVASNMRMGDYQWNQGFNRDVFNDAYSQNRGNLQDYMALMGLQSNLNTQDINNAATIQNLPLQYQSQFANMASGIGSGFGTTTGNTSAQGNPFLGALGGWQLGQQLGKSWGA